MDDKFVIREGGEFVLTYPVFALLGPGGFGTIHLSLDEDRTLPLFTDRDNVDAFLRKTGFAQLVVCELPDPETLKNFITRPPTRSSSRQVVPAKWVFFDPIDLKPRFTWLKRRKDLLRMLGFDGWQAI